MDLVTWSLEELAKRFEDAGVDFRGDPVRWIRDRLKEHIWSKQAEILESVRDNRYTAVHACHGVGKSFIASRTICWWISTNDVDDVYVVSTAPTARQVEAILWREIKKAHKKGKLAGRINQGNQPLWKIDGEEVGMGRKPADHDAHGFQGIHAKRVLVVVDEACGVPKLLWDAIDALATNEFSRVLAIGNPDDPGTHFRTICQPGSGWNVIRIDGRGSPNMGRSEIDKLDQVEPGLTAKMYDVLAECHVEPSTEEIPENVRPMLTSPLWVVERAKRWGTNSALWTSKVRGLFPDSNMEGVIPLGWVERAIDRWIDWQDARAPELAGHPLRRGQDRRRHDRYGHAAGQLRLHDPSILGARHQGDDGRLAPPGPAHRHGGQDGPAVRPGHPTPAVRGRRDRRGRRSGGQPPAPHARAAPAAPAPRGRLQRLRAVRTDGQERGVRLLQQPRGGLVAPAGAAGPASARRLAHHAAGRRAATRRPHRAEVEAVRLRLSAEDQGGAEGGHPGAAGALAGHRRHGRHAVLDAGRTEGCRLGLPGTVGISTQQRRSGRLEQRRRPGRRALGLGACKRWRDRIPARARRPWTKR